MRTILYLFTASIFLVFISCQKPEGNSYVELKKIDTQSIHDIRSSDISKYYHFDSLHSTYFVDTLLLPKSFHFEEGEITFPVKENDFEEYKIKSTDKYYPLDSFALKNYKFKVIMYLTDGENDTNIMNVKINSYDSNNNLIDALLLDQHFNFEIECFRNFSISSDKKIKIIKYAITYANYSEEGDIIGGKSVPQRDSVIANYLIDDSSGKFEKIK